ncbi:MAG: hypothetical protein CR972_01780 [Candidatus Moraniibacteriota bacterium]|nr:MAG: hypothetical protein CR972_01780 [Candidatus Moranbacteria bacterium]
MITSPIVVVLMAGGSGERLYQAHLSGKKKPKQFQNIISENFSLIQEGFQYVRSITRRDLMFASTTEEWDNLIREELPEIKSENIIVEPCKRDTMAAVAFIAKEIHKKIPNAIVVTVPSDHVLKNVFDFTQAVHAACETVEKYPQKIGLLGIKPDEPNTMLGYVKIGKKLGIFNGQDVFTADSFKEKPDKATAVEYQNSDQYYWNGGHFIFRAQTIIDLVRKYEPHLNDVLERLTNCDNKEERAEIFGSVRKDSFSTAIMEVISADQRFVVPADLDWSDVGTWNSLWAHCPQDKNGNVCRGNVSTIESNNNLIFSNNGIKVITLGINGLRVFVKKDMVLIVDHKSADDIKKVIHFCEEIED